MNLLTLAAGVAAIVTIALNAHHGFRSSPVLHYAVLFATLNAALDIAKCSCLVGMGKAWAAGRPLSSVALFVLFIPLFINSLWCGVSEITISRGGTATQHVADTQTRARAEAEHARLAAELATMQANATFTATAACALPKSSQAKAFCTRIDDTKAALTRIEAQLAAPAPTDPQPHLSLVQKLTGLGLPTLQFADALKLVVLAEIVGSIGFYLGLRINARPPQKPVQPVSWFEAVRKRLARKTPPAALLKASDAPPAKPEFPTPAATAPTVTWKVPKAS